MTTRVFLRGDRMIDHVIDVYVVCPVFYRRRCTWAVPGKAEVWHIKAASTLRATGIGHGSGHTIPRNTGVTCYDGSSSGRRVT